MFPVVAVFAGIAIAATTASWILNGKTEQEKRRQNELNEELDDIRASFDTEAHRHQQKRFELARKNYNRLRVRFLEEVEFYKNEKKEIRSDLNKLLETIDKELQNEAISPYQRASLLNNKNQVEDAKNRINAYWEYLNWFEKKLDDLAKYKKYEQINTLQMPQPLLPEDYLYLGKLAYITKDEIVVGTDKTIGWNEYGQRLSLNNFFNKNENLLLEKYGDDEEFMVLIDHTKGKYFNASVIKGRLYQHILEDIPFYVKPKFNEKINQENLTLLYEGVYLNIRRKDKLYPLKRYKDYDSFEVKVKEYDLLLKNVFVSEKYDELNQDELDRVVPILFDYRDLEKVKELEDSLSANEFEAVSLDGNKLVMKLDNFLLHVEIDKTSLVLENIDCVDLQNLTTNSFVLPFEFVLVEKRVFFRTYKKLLLDVKTTFEDFALFINEQFNYINYANKTHNKDFEFFKKWQRIIEYQIEDNSFDIFEVEFENYEVDDNIVSFYIVELSLYGKNLQNKRPQDVLVEVNGIKIGSLYDYSFDDSIFKLKVDFLEDVESLFESKKLVIKVKTYQAVLQKQKKALKDFAFSKIVNQELKQMLISPSLISYKDIGYEFELDFKNKNLTQNQKEIVQKAFNEKNIFLIQGPPGTGKTTIIKEMIFQTITHNPYSKILIVSQQNVAVDNVLDGIDRENREWFEKDGHTIVRVAPNENKIQYENIKEFTVERWFENYKESIKNKFIELEQQKQSNSLLYDFSKEWLELVYKSDFREVDNEVKELLISKHQILGATCVGLANKSLGLDLVEFDVAIIDEAGRATAPELLIPMLRAKKVILIGDHNQLPPTIDRKLLQKLEDDDEDELSVEDLEILKKSFFEELFEKTSNTNKAMLDEQFRMPSAIGDMISHLFYDDKLKNGHIKDSKDFLDPQNVLRWVDVAGKHEVDGMQSSYNELEVTKIVELLNMMDSYLKKVDKTKSVGIITPYSAQKRRVRKRVGSLSFEKLENIKIDTVDSFQGEEADIIIYSTVKSHGNISFLIDKKRLNVAISRTKENLFFVGNKQFFYKAKTKKGEVNLFREIIQHIDRYERN